MSFRTGRRSFLKTIVSSFVLAPFALAMSRVFAKEEKAKEQQTTKTPGADDLRVLSDRPLNAETPVDLLDEEVTPTHRIYVRNNGIVPPIASQKDVSDWHLVIDGEVDKPLQLSLD